MQKSAWYAIAGYGLLVWGMSIPLAKAQSIVPAADGMGTQVQQTGGDYTITGGTLSADQQNLFHSFGQFNVLTGESATFFADPSVLNILGRVNGGNASVIDGLLQVSGSNANLYLINPSGILFGENAVLNLQGSFTATTADQVNFGANSFSAVGTPDYTALVGNPSGLTFTRSTPGAVVNAGTLTVQPGQAVMLVGGQVLNTGTIAAPGGDIVITAVEGGQFVRIEQAGHLLNLELAALPVDPATGLPFTPLSLPELLTVGSAIAPVNQVIVNPDGTVQLASGAPVGSSPASTTVSGTVSVAGDTGGDILALGQQVVLAGATLDATGDQGGGTVRIGGDYQGGGSLPTAQTTMVDSTSAIAADAISSGNGGTVIVWSDGGTVFAGEITARGGAIRGDGGLIETSGAGTLGVTSTARVDASASNGTSGTWLLDPPDLEVVATGGIAVIAGGINVPDTATTVDAGAIVTALNGNNINLLADNSITVTAAIDASGNTGSGNLTLTAPTINLNEEITLGGFFGSVLDGTANTVNVGTRGRLENAIAVAIAGATINLAAATYQITDTLVLDQDVTLAGKGSSATVIDGSNISTSALSVTNDATVNLLNLAIANTQAITPGAGIDNDGNLTLSGVTVRDNRSGSLESVGRGGGIFNSGTLNIANSTLENNQAIGFTLGGQTFSGSGGGLYNTNTGIVTITNSQIQGNSTPDGNGGGISNLGSMRLDGVTITGNIAEKSGGGIFNAQGFLTVENSVITGNTVTTGNGGGIDNFIGGSLTLDNSTVSNNTAQFGGGVNHSGEGTSGIFNSTLSGNQALGDAGGGAIGTSQDLVVLNSTLSGNRANQGAGIFVTDSTLNIANSTLSGNTATAEGGGIFMFDGTVNVDSTTIAFNSAGTQGGGIDVSGGDLFVESSLLTGNTAPTDANIAGDFTSEGNNLIGANGQAGAATNALLSSDIIPSEAIAQILDSTLTIHNSSATAAVDPTLKTTATHALVPGSPAIDAGSGNSNDQRGVAIVNGVRDIGAFESRGFRIVPAGSIIQKTLINTQFPDTLAVRIISDFSEPVGGGRVVFEAPPSGSSASLSSPLVTVDSNGFGEVTAIANEEPGEYTVTANVLNGSSSPLAFSLTNLPSALDPSVLTPLDDLEVDMEDPLEDWDDQGNTVDDSVAIFEEFLGVEALPFEDFDALDRARSITGVPPALVYASFVPASEALQADAATSQTKGLTDRDRTQQIIAQSELGVRRSTPPTNEDVLELVLVTADSEPRRFSTGATRREVLQAVRQFQIELTDRTRRRLDTYLVPAQSLYDWLVAPLEETLAQESIGHISFVLDSGLRTIPIAALHDGKQFIIERYSVGLMPSLTLTDTRIGNIRNAAVLATGASEFADQPDLPAVPVELAAIEQLWPGSQYLNEAFTPDRLVEAREVEPYPILHMATHGQFSPGALSNSYIQFWDQRMSLDQLPQLRLGEPTVELLVLSACRTVLGDNEAELGFAGVAVKSGAKSAIATLWQVSDWETAGLMAELYTQLEDSPIKAEALRQAQLAMLRGEVTVRDGQLVWSGGSEALPPDVNPAFGDTRHPYYWSAFTLVGSPW